MRRPRWSAASAGEYLSLTHGLEGDLFYDAQFKIGGQIYDYNDYPEIGSGHYDSWWLVESVSSDSNFYEGQGGALLSDGNLAIVYEMYGPDNNYNTTVKVGVFGVDGSVVTAPVSIESDASSFEAYDP
ncbi:MAG: hypothetical protein ACI8S6_004074, partial [Myxococcota bacterium]